MSGVVALRCALEEDLSALVALLRQAGMPHRVSEEAGMQVLRVPDERCAALVQQWYRELPVNDVAESHAAPLLQPRRWWQDGLHALRQQPVTLGVLLLALVVAVLSGLGEQRTVVSWLTFTSVVEQGGQLWLLDLPATLQQGDWWRLLSPILLHFGLLHLAMNSLWYWELGRRIEWRQGRLWLLGFTLGFGLLSNLTQYLVEGPGVFGGLSGVLYGLLGHCWLFNRLAPTPPYRLPPGTVGLMLGWLLFCLTGFTETLGLGAIANAAHVGGLVAGCITGVIGGLLARRR